jgi:hypothetical protein
MSAPTSRAVAALGLAAVLVLTLAAFVPRQDTAPTSAQDEPFRVEYYYKVRWGHFQEWIELYKKNHYPVLEILRERGDIVEMSAASPRYHAGEGTRWDFRFTIVWRNAEVAAADRDMEPILRELYPDIETFRAEEQRRFQLLEEHLDVPVARYDLTEW